MKFRTTTAVYLPDDRLVDGGVEIGQDTNYPLPASFRPSRTMEPLDQEAKDALEALEEGESDDFEEGIAAELEAENRRLKQRIAQMEGEFQMMGSSEPQNREPFRPLTDTGPSMHQANVGKNPDGTDLAFARPTSGPGQTNNPGDPSMPPRIDTPVGASSTTPPSDSIQLPPTDESPKPVPRRSIFDKGEEGKQIVPELEPEDGPQTGIDDPSPMNFSGSPQRLSNEEIQQNEESNAPDAETPSSERSGDQPVEEPNKDLIVKDTETFMPNNEPNAPNATGPAGSKPSKRK